MKLRQGWQSVIEDGITYLYRPNENTFGYEWYVYYLDHPDQKKEVVACTKELPYLNEGDFRVFSSIMEAHKYLLSVGSESPWEVAE